jgi:hypothetical protein
LCKTGRHFISKVVSGEYADNLSIELIQFHDDSEDYESFISSVQTLLNINEVEKIKIFNFDFIRSINEKYKNNSNINETLASTSSSANLKKRTKIVTVIDLENKTAQTLQGYRAAVKWYTKAFSKAAIIKHINKNTLVNDRFIFKSDFVDNLTTEFGQLVTLTNDQLEIFRNTHISP